MSEYLVTVNRRVVRWPAVANVKYQQCSPPKAGKRLVVCVGSKNRHVHSESHSMFEAFLVESTWSIVLFLQCKVHVTTNNRHAKVTVNSVETPNNTSVKRTTNNIHRDSTLPITHHSSETRASREIVRGVACRHVSAVCTAQIRLIPVADRAARLTSRRRQLLNTPR